MNCEFCKRPIGHYEVAHGIQYGTIKGYPEEFVPANDSAYTIVCKPCGNKLYSLIYMALRNMPKRPTYNNHSRQSR